jgi:hypothetical protein
MKNLMLAAIAATAIILLWAMAEAADLQVSRTVMATVSVPHVLNFMVTETTVPLGSIYPEPGFFWGSASLFSTDSWSIEVEAPVHLADGLGHTLQAPVFMLMDNMRDMPGSYPSLRTFYSQAFTLGDRAGSYTGTVRWIAQTIF